MGEYCEGLNALNLNHAEENDDLAETNAEENDDGAKTPTEENIDLNKATAEEFNEATREAAEENNALGQDAAEENTDLNEGPSWGLPPAANPWAASGKSGGPTGTSPAPSPLPSNLNDPISPPGHPRIKSPPFHNRPHGKKKKGFSTQADTTFCSLLQKFHRTACLILIFQSPHSMLKI